MELKKKINSVQELLKLIENEAQKRIEALKEKAGSSSSNLGNVHEEN
jgi:hypothetical protein